MRLNLLRKWDGKPHEKLVKFEDSNPNNYLNILLLFINYADFPNPRRIIRKETSGLIQVLFSQVSPFNKHEVKQRINVFTPKPSDHLVLSGPSFVPQEDGIYEKSQWKQIVDYIKELEYPGFIKLAEKRKGDAEKIWTEPYLDDGSVNRSYGCLGIILGGDLPDSEFFAKTDAIFTGAFGTIQCFTGTLSSGKHNRIWLTSAFAHELGHALGLADEYEEKPETLGPVVVDRMTGIESGNVRKPNVASKTAILYPYVQPKPGIVPTFDEIDFEKIPWGVWCEKKAPEPNQSREYPKSECVDSLNNNYFYNAEPFESEMAFCRLPFDYISSPRFPSIPPPPFNPFPLNCIKPPLPLCLLVYTREQHTRVLIFIDHLSFVEWGFLLMYPAPNFSVPYAKRG